jgi:hypothetical protein
MFFPDPDFFPSRIRIQDPWVRKELEPGSRIRIRNTVKQDPSKNVFVILLPSAKLSFKQKQINNFFHNITRCWKKVGLLTFLIKNGEHDQCLTLPCLSFVFVFIVPKPLCRLQANCFFVLKLSCLQTFNNSPL